jgi:hypothetical protein
MTNGSGRRQQLSGHPEIFYFISARLGLNSEPNNDKKKVLTAIYDRRPNLSVEPCHAG